MKHFVYWFGVGLSIALVIGINMIFDFSIFPFLYFWLVLIIIISPTVISHFIEKIYPKKWYDRNRKLYKERNFEKKFFEIIKIKKWKDNVPQFLNIKNITQAKDNTDVRESEYMDFFVFETCRAEHAHLCFIIAAMVCWLFVPDALKLKFGLPVLLVWSFYNLLSILIQRYNRPRMISFLEKLKKRESKTESITEQQPEQTEDDMIKDCK